jgi:hypothetical protein
VGSSLHRGPVGEPGGVCLLGLLRGKENAYLGSSSVDPEDIKSYVWYPSGALARNRAPLISKQIMGHRGSINTGSFIMYSGITKIYYTKTVGHVFTKPIQIEGTTQKFFPSKLFFIVVHISAARRCECM